MAITEGLFVTGTDTSVGKSLVTCAGIKLLREQGIDAVGFKPVATGEVGGSWGDAVAIHEASGGVEPIEKICPLRFALPLAPTLAAAHEGIEPNMDLARGVLARLCARHSAIIVEGIGGVLTPLDKKTLVVDMIAQVGFPALIVCRAGLGTISQTLLVIRELERSNLPIAGVIMNVTHPEDTPLAPGAKSEIERIGGVRVLATIPHLPATDVSPSHSKLVTRVIASLVKQIDFRTLLGSEGTRRGVSSRFRRRRATD